MDDLKSSLPDVFAIKFHVEREHWRIEVLGIPAMPVSADTKQAIAELLGALDADCRLAREVAALVAGEP